MIAILEMIFILIIEPAAGINQSLTLLKVVINTTFAS